MTKSRLLFVAGILAATMATLLVGARADSPSVQSPPPLPDVTLKDCDTPFNHYYLGSSFQGLALEHSRRQCTAPNPERSEAAGGAIDPDSLGRSHNVQYIYGTCEEGPDYGCAPPLEIETWPACERSPADYTVGIPEAPVTLEPRRVLTVRGVPARDYGEGRLELSTGDVTVVIFGTSEDLILSAAQQLRTAPGSPQQRGPDQLLPPPVPGSIDGTLAC
jgi:hypothetical protein